MAVMLPADVLRRHDAAAAHLPAAARAARASAPSAASTRANTLGSIVGVIVAVHLGLPLLGLRGIADRAARRSTSRSASSLIGAARRAAAARRRRLGFAAALRRSPLVAACRDSRSIRIALAAGVYRTGVAQHRRRIRMSSIHRDGKTATVDVLRTRRTASSLRTNGKTDASMRASDPTGGWTRVDEATTTAARGAAARATGPTRAQRRRHRLRLRHDDARRCSASPRIASGRHDRDRAGDDRGRARFPATELDRPTTTRAAASSSTTPRPTSRAPAAATTSSSPSRRTRGSREPRRCSPRSSTRASSRTWRRAASSRSGFTPTSSARR